MIFKYNPKQEKEAIQSCLQILESDQVTLSKFLIDLLNGQHKKWNLYKKELSYIKEADAKGRTTPTRKSRPSGNTEYGKYYARAKHGMPFIKQLPLHTCDTDKEKAKMIMESDAPPQIKVDLLSVLKLK